MNRQVSQISYLVYLWSCRFVCGVAIYTSYTMTERTVNETQHFKQTTKIIVSSNNAVVAEYFSLCFVQMILIPSHVGVKYFGLAHFTTVFKAFEYELSTFLKK